MQDAPRVPDDDLRSGDVLSDEELTVLALAADPRAPLDPDAVPWSGVAAFPQGLLPDWYMPRPPPPPTTVVIVAIIVGILVIDAFGLCITSGFLSLA